MKESKIENVAGALAVALSDSLHLATQAQAPEPGPAAAAIALLGREPGLPIEQLRRALRLSHPGTVLLIDHLAEDGLVERRASAEDRRAVALLLTPAGEEKFTAILSTRRTCIGESLQSLSREERETFGQLADKLLGSLVKDVDQAYQVCRLCDRQSCKACPVEGAVEPD